MDAAFSDSNAYLNFIIGGDGFLTMQKQHWYPNSGELMAASAIY